MQSNAPIVITEELIQYAYRDSIKLVERIAFLLKVNFIGLFALLGVAALLSITAPLYSVNPPEFYSPDGKRVTHRAILNQTPSPAQYAGFIRSASEELLSLSFETVNSELLSRKRFFIEGKEQAYFSAMYGTSSYSLGPQSGSFARTVIDNSYIVSAVAVGTPVQVGNAFMIDGRMNYLFKINVLQGVVGVGEEVESRRISVRIIVEQVPRNLSPYGLLVRAFHVG